MHVALLKVGDRLDLGVLGAATIVNIREAHPNRVLRLDVPLTGRKVEVTLSSLLIVDTLPAEA